MGADLSVGGARQHVDDAAAADQDGGAEDLPPVLIERLLPPAAVMIVISFGLVILAEWIRRRGERRLGLQTGIGEPSAPAPVE